MNHPFFRRGLSFLLSALMCLSLIAVPARADDAPFRVSLTSTDLIISGSTGSLTAEAVPVPPATDLPADLSYSWSSGDSGVVYPTGSGATASVTPKSPGSTTVTCTATGTIDGLSYSASASCPVTVVGVKLSSDTLSLYTRGTSTLTADLYGSLGGVSWSSGNESVATVDSGGTVTGISAGATTITATAGGYSATCTVTVEDRAASVITASASAGSALSFSSLASSMNAQSVYVLGTSLSYVTNLSVSTSAGTLYYGYVSESVPGAGVGSNENYDYAGTSNGRNLQDISFVPKNTFSGTATIQYTGFNAAGAFFTGTIAVSVASSSVISYSTSGQSRVDFQVSDFAAVCQSRTGYNLSYVTFSPPSSSKGTLYYNYSGSSLDNKVSSGTAYYRSKSPYLSNVSFVPASNYNGTVTVPYQGYDTAGNSFSGEVDVTVSGNSGSGNITYSTNKNTPVVFDTDDFDSLCEDLTDARLYRVRFNLPSSSIGTLYYNYTSSSSYGSKVSSSSYYYRSSSPYLDNVSFVPASGWTGTVTLSFTGYSVDGDSFSGTVSITVNSVSSSTISYSILKNAVLTFDEDDFDDLCEDLTDAHLSRVRFNLPSSSIGTLYYNYTSSSNYGSKVSSSSYYYRSSSPYLDNVSFVPASDWTGTVTLSFTGYSTDDDSFSGTINISVRSTSSTAISYSTTQNTALTIDTDDFDDLCEDLTDAHLSRVRFNLPSSSIGTLYYNYTSASNYGSKVSSSSYYYRSSSPYLDNVSFVPASDWTGTVTLSFTGYSTDGDSFSGTVSIKVTGSTSAGIIYYSTTAGTPVTFQASSFQTACSARNTGSFVSAVFNLPASGFGQLRYQYVSAKQAGSAVSSTQSFSAYGTPGVSSVTFVPASGYTGTTAISYKGLDNRGNSYTGTILVTVTSASSSHFHDLGSYSWAVPSIEYLYSAGVVYGTSEGAYSPAASISRGSFMLMVCRAFGFSATGITGFADVPSDSVYASAVTTARALGIAQGNGSYFYPANPLTREQAAVFLLRAMRADGWTIADGQRSDLAAYSDRAAVSEYAVGAVAAMVKLNILQGSTSGQLNPKGTLTRAQMAVILHRALILS